MFKYIAKRIAYFIPTLLIISLITFGLSKVTPGDPVKLALGNRDSGGDAGQALEKMASEKAYYEKAENLGLNLPTFYLAVTSSALPDTMYKFVKKADKETLTDLTSQYGNWKEISAYHSQIRDIELSLFDVVVDNTIFENMKEIKQKVQLLYMTSEDIDINNHIKSLLKNTEGQPRLNSVYIKTQKLQALYEEMKEKKTGYKNYIPSLNWYGTNNQYHRWLLGNAPWFFGEAEPGQSKGFLRGDFGQSYLDSRPIASKLKDAIPWTLLMNILSLIIFYSISIPVGVYSATHKGTKTDRFTTVLLFLMYSLPSFWIATLLVTFITTDEYGLNLFPTYGLGEVDDDMSFLEVVRH
jgi:peptide/nickel transport system permease protein